VDREAIARAALAEIDGLSLGAVARRLGVAKSTLYHHVAGREELTELAAAAALESWVRPDAGLGWEEFVRGFAESIRDCLMANPGLDLALLGLHDAPPAMWEAMRWAAGVLVEAGVPEETARTAFPLVASIAHDEARHRRAVEANGGEWPEEWLDGRLALVIDGMRTRLDS
jgi:AcrR family transcriptional regulator